MNVALLLLVLPAMYVVALVYGAWRCVVDVPLVPKEATPSPPSWPRLSVIVPACNEEASLEAATRAKLACDYPDLEIVIVEDRSIDKTPEIADRLAASDPRIQVVHLTELPPGWLGKVHALHRGVLASRGEWILFSDADVHLSPSLLRRVVAEAERSGLDFVALVPHLLSSTFWLDVALSSFLRNLCAFGRLWRVKDPSSRAAVGGGTFNLVRRRALDASPGFPWLALEVGDDVVLAQMLKDSGARATVMNGRDDVSLYFCRSLRELAHLLEKNGFAALGGYSMTRHLALTALLLYLDTFPLAGLFFHDLAFRVVSAVLVLGSMSSNVALARWVRRPLLPALVPGVGHTLLLLFLLRSAALAKARGAIVWRGTRYPLEDLRRASRLRFF